MGEVTKRSFFVGLVLLCISLAFAATEASAQQLYAGTSGFDEESWAENGKVYAYQGGTNWTAIPPNRCRSGSIFCIR
jgi:hypothetical protein